MKNEKKIFDAVTDLPDSAITEASVPRRRPAVRIIAIAASLAIIVGVVGILWRNPGSQPAISQVVFPAAYAYDDYETRQKVYQNNPVSDSFISALGSFSYATASKLLASGGNVNYSPVSLYYALSLAALGAKGETEAELLSLLGCDSTLSLAENAQHLYNILYTDNSIGRLKISNSLWIDDEIALKADYAKAAAEQLYSACFNIDFSKSDTGKQISSWVANSTSGQIKPDIETDPEQLLAIINTVYFYDQWINEFDKSLTAPGKFNSGSGGGVDVDYMNSTFISASFARGDGFTRASLQLKNGGSMIFILPDKGVSVSELYADADRLRQSFEGGTELNGEVVWQIPKFDFSSSLDAAAMLKQLSVSAPFDSRADFSGISSSPLFVSSVNQQTHIAIDEKGIEAAAFTDISFAGSGMPTDRAEMILDRPFIYGINVNGTLLFTGVCQNPAAK